MKKHFRCFFFLAKCKISLWQFSKSQFLCCYQTYNYYQLCLPLTENFSFERLPWKWMRRSSKIMKKSSIKCAFHEKKCWDGSLGTSEISIRKVFVTAFTPPDGWIFIWKPLNYDVEIFTWKFWINPEQELLWTKKGVKNVLGVFFLKSFIRIFTLWIDTFVSVMGRYSLCQKLVVAIGLKTWKTMFFLSHSNIIFHIRSLKSNFIVESWLVFLKKWFLKLIAIEIYSSLENC